MPAGNPSGCIQCGRCCVGATLRIPSEMFGDMADSVRYLNYFRCDAGAQIVDDKEVLTIRIPHICSKLGERDGHIFFCTIYDTRPQLCREYLCKQARARAGKKEGAA